VRQATFGERAPRLWSIRRPRVQAAGLRASWSERSKRARMITRWMRSFGGWGSAGWKWRAARADRAEDRCENLFAELGKESGKEYSDASVLRGEPIASGCRELFDEAFAAACGSRSWLATGCSRGRARPGLSGVDRRSPLAERHVGRWRHSRNLLGQCVLGWWHSGRLRRRNR
jgi:hypothetical protein